MSIWVRARRNIDQTKTGTDFRDVFIDLTSIYDLRQVLRYDEKTNEFLPTGKYYATYGPTGLTAIIDPKDHGVSDFLLPIISGTS